jgi:hypothetical protein
VNLYSFLSIKSFKKTDENHTDKIMSKHVITILGMIKELGSEKGVSSTDTREKLKLLYDKLGAYLNKFDTKEGVKSAIPTYISH